MNDCYQVRAWDDKNKIMLSWGLMCQSAFNIKTVSEQRRAEHPSIPLLYRVLTDPTLIKMQFLGIKDKYGERIYERDYITYADEVVEVYFDESELEVRVKFQDGKTEKIQKDKIGYIVGNIYEGIKEK